MRIQLMSALIASTALASVSAVNAETTVSTKGGLKATSDNHSFQLGGRIQYDYNRSELDLGDGNGASTYESAFDTRRARIYVKGNVSEDWHYKAQFNVSGSGFEDLYLRYKGWGKPAVVTMGQQKAPFGLEELTSSKDISVPERSGFTERYAIGRVEGVQLSGALNDIYYGVMLFTEDNAEGNNDEDEGIAARVAFAPVHTDSQLIHVGAAMADTPEKEFMGLEFAAVSGALHFQSEFFDGDEIDINDVETSVDGYYFQAGWVFTGESRPYKGGKFKRIKPAKPSGAWEGVFRYGDGNGAFGDVELGDNDAEELSLALNYYPNNNVRLSASYMTGEANDVDGSGNTREGEEFRIRMQLTY